MTSILPKRLARPRRLAGNKLLSLVETMATPHQLDRYLELVNPMASVRDLRAEVTDVLRQTDDTVTLTLRPTWQWDGFEAGQFVQIGVVINGVRHTRCYSPACSQYRADGRIELTIKAHPEGLVSQYLHAHAAPGLIVSLTQASGVFAMPAQRPEKVLLISGGSGITPVLAMLRTLVDEGHQGPITFLHYADKAADVPYRDELQHIAANRHNVEVVFAYTAQPESSGLSGFFGIEHLEHAAPWHADAATYLCGPPGLMKGVRTLFTELGLENRLYTEEFAPAIAVGDDDATGTISFTASSVEAENNGGTLLDQAEAAGLTPEYGCRMGICFSCTAVKTSGCTKNLKTGETDSDPDQPIQLCISAAVGDVAIEI